MVNKVRHRVGLENIQNVIGNHPSKKEFNQFLLKARARELGFENVRLFDMVRRKRKDLFTQKLIGLNLYKKDNAARTPPPPPNVNKCNAGYCFQYYNIKKLQTRFWINDFTPKIYLSPIPQREINKSYGLIQNPGW